MKYLLLIPMLFLLTACPETDNAEKRQAEQTRALLGEADRQIGMPLITNFTEKKFAKHILELRDKSIATHTYVQNKMQGCFIYLGTSLGYGLPYAVQFTNPEKKGKWVESPNLPQADPNGLYMPDSLSATWVLLYSKEADKAQPVYVEQELLISPFKLERGLCK